MKKRTGFVSNSSSSAFIIAFSHKPKSVEDLKEIMFGKQEWHYTGIYGDDVEKDISTQELAEAVFNDIERKATKKQIFESIRNGYFQSYMIPELFPGMLMSDTRKLSWQNKDEREEIDRILKETRKINDERALAIAEAFRKGHDDKWIASLQYHDDTRLGSILEHSDVFNRLDYIRTSYH